jgi:hypothetical protein
MSKVIWKAEITEDMITHLTPEQSSKLQRDLSDAVNTIGQAVGVGREYKDGKLKENNHG